MVHVDNVMYVCGSKCGVWIRRWNCSTESNTLCVIPPHLRFHPQPACRIRCFPLSDPFYHYSIEVGWLLQFYNLATSKVIF